MSKSRQNQPADDDELLLFDYETDKAGGVRNVVDPAAHAAALGRLTNRLSQSGLDEGSSTHTDTTDVVPGGLNDDEDDENAGLVPPPELLEPGEVKVGQPLWAHHTVESDHNKAGGEILLTWRMTVSSAVPLQRRLPARFSLLFKVFKWAVRERVDSKTSSFLDEFLLIVRSEDLAQLRRRIKKQIIVNLQHMAEDLWRNAHDILLDLYELAALMANDPAPQRDYGDVVTMINNLATWGVFDVADAAAMRQVATDYHTRLTENSSLDATPIFKDTSGFIPPSSNTYRSEVHRLHEAIFKAAQQGENYETLLRHHEGTRPIRLALRDAIAFPASFYLTTHWLLNMLLSFFLLVVLTFVNVDLINLQFLMEPYSDSSDGCFFESKSECCGRNIKSPVLDPTRTGDPSQLVAGGTISCCSVNCAFNNETYDQYAQRWINFVGAATGDCADMLLAVGGARAEDTPDLITDLTEVEDVRVKLKNSNNKEISFIQSDMLRHKFLTSTCASPDKCQRFVLVTKQRFHKHWHRHLATHRVHYIAFVESSWRLVDTKCQRNLRQIVVPITSEGDTTFIVGGVCAGVAAVCTILFLWQQHAMAKSAVCEIYAYFERRLARDHDAVPARSFFWRLLARCVAALFVVAALLCFTAALFAPDPVAGLALLCVAACMCLLFTSLSIARWIVTLWDSLQKQPTAAPVASRVVEHGEIVYDYARQEPWEWRIGRYQRDANFVNATSSARLLLNCACLLYFITASLLLSANRSLLDQPRELLLLFETWTNHRSLMILFHLAFVPFGLELVIYLPHLFGASTYLPRLRWLIIFYGIVFVWYPNSPHALPTTIDQLGESVLSFLDQIAIDFGPIGSGQRRLGSALGLLLLFFIFLQVVYDIEEAHKEKNRVVFRDCLVHIYSVYRFPPISFFTPSRKFIQADSGTSPKSEPQNEAQSGRLLPTSSSVDATAALLNVMAHTPCLRRMSVPPLTASFLVSSTMSELFEKARTTKRVHFGDGISIVDLERHLHPGLGSQSLTSLVQTLVQNVEPFELLTLPRIAAKTETPMSLQQLVDSALHRVVAVGDIFVCRADLSRIERLNFGNSHPNTNLILTAVHLGSESAQLFQQRALFSEWNVQALLFELQAVVCVSRSETGSSNKPTTASTSVCFVRPPETDGYRDWLPSTSWLHVRDGGASTVAAESEMRRACLRCDCVFVFKHVGLATAAHFADLQADSLPAAFGADKMWKGRACKGELERRLVLDFDSGRWARAVDQTLTINDNESDKPESI